MFELLLRTCTGRGRIDRFSQVSCGMRWTHGTQCLRRMQLWTPQHWGCGRLLLRSRRGLLVFTTRWPISSTPLPRRATTLLRRRCQGSSLAQICDLPTCSPLRAHGAGRLHLLTTRSGSWLGLHVDHGEGSIWAPPFTPANHASTKH